MAAAAETETASTAEAAATSTAEAAAVVGRRRHRKGNIGTTMTATTGDEDFDAGRVLEGECPSVSSPTIKV